MNKKQIINLLTVALTTTQLNYSINLADLQDAINPNAQITQAQFIDAAFKGNMQSAIDFLGNGGNVNSQEADGTTALHNAVHQMNKELTTLILSAGNNNLNAQDKFGYTPLHWAILNNDQSLANILLNQNNIDINIIDNSGKTALHLAAERGLTELVCELLVYNARTNIADLSGSTAKQLAQQRNHQQTVNAIEAFEVPAAPAVVAQPAAPIVQPAPVVIPVPAPIVPVAVEQELCPLCQDEENEARLIALPCHRTHRFHAACVAPWLARHNTCPMCRAHMPVGYNVNNM